MEIEGESLARRRDRAVTTAIVAAAAEAGVFRALGEGDGEAAELAGRAGLDPRALEVLLPVLEELELAHAGEDGRWAPTEKARRHLCDPEADEYEAGGLPLWLHNLRGFTRLGEVLRTGEPLEPGGTRRDEEGLRRYMAGMAAAPRWRIRRIVDACLERVEDPKRALDLGGGPGLMSRAFIEAGLEATMVDTPETVDFVADEYGLAEVAGLELVAADFTEDPLPEGPFDVVLLSNIAHIYGPQTNRALVAKVAEVTARGGVVAVADFLRGRSPRAARFALVMLMRTEAGNTWSEDEIGAWMREAGLEDPRTVELDEERQLVSAVRP